MSTPALNERVLIPVAVLEGEHVDQDLIDLLSTVEVVVLGYHVVPEQTTPSQMRLQFEKQAQNAIDSIVEAFDTPSQVTDRLIFTHDLDQSIDRVELEIGATARAHPNPLGPVRSLLVVLDEHADGTRLAQFTARLRGSRDIDITLVGAERDDETIPISATVARTIEIFKQHGIPEDAIETTTVDARSFVDAIVDAAINHDVTIMREHTPDWRSILFGEVEERVAAESLGPVLEVKQPRREEA